MPALSATAAAAARGEVLRATYLAHFDFASGPLRVHPGYGRLKAAGEVWSGLGELGQIENMEISINGSAPPFSASLSGVDPANVASALDVATEIAGRELTVLLQFFDEDWQAFPEQIVTWRGFMDRAPIRAPDVNTRTIGIVAETVFALRGLPPWGWYTDRDQQKRFPGDLGLIEVPAMVNRNKPWVPGA